jgi:alpha-mannosidase
MLGAAILSSTSLVGADDGVKPTKPNRPTLYVVGYSHLDTEWLWSYPQVIREFIPKTLHNNFSLFEKYPDYTFNWTGANRYRLVKEYYPADYAKLKSYVKKGRWFPNGSSLEEMDVNAPSPESLLRHILYGNQFFRREFGVAGDDFILPDCFGFPADLPSILHHAGVKGFSTQKLTWGSAVGIPFNIGTWTGPDGHGILSALNATPYDSNITDNLTSDSYWTSRVEKDPLRIDYRYFGTGDTGGSPNEASVQNLEASLHGSGPISIVAGRADQIFHDLSADDARALPTYQGDLELTQHSAGSLTSESEMKRWNHENELLADAAEKSSVIANWLGALPYDHDRLTDAWLRFLPGQFHDLMAGTAIPKAYDFAWNDQTIAQNEFAGVLSASVAATARNLDTRVPGVPLVVYNPLSIAREDVVDAKVTLPSQWSLNGSGLVAVGPDGKLLPVQVKGRKGNSVEILFQPKLEPVSFAVFGLRPGAAPASKGLKVAAGATDGVHLGYIENLRYRVTLNLDGDLASVYDKFAKRELLSAPSRLGLVHHNPTDWPAWNMDWRDAQKPPQAYIGSPASVRVVENGPVRVALQIDREFEGSRFVETVRLAGGTAGNRVEIAQSIDWKGKEWALKATFPLTVSNPKATYNWGMGTVQRGNDDPRKYEVGSHDWFDLTDSDGKYGVTVLSGFKLGSNKPSDNQLNLTLLYTPGVNGGFEHQATQDWGHHEFLYGLSGHFGSWQNGETEWDGTRLNQPPIAFQTVRHGGELGRAFGFLHVSSHSVAVSALKKAERGNAVILRLQELSGRPAPDTHVSFGANLQSAVEVDGQERPIGPAKVDRGHLVASLGGYEPRAYALTFSSAPKVAANAPGHPLKLGYNMAGFSSGHGRADGNFDGRGRSLPGELLPKSLEVDGVAFKMPRPGEKSVQVPSGETLSLPKGKNRTLYLVGASARGDREATFRFGAKEARVVFQAWDGYVGQWDHRSWQGTPPEEASGWPYPLAGLERGYVKPATIAWYADHRRLADGQDDPYAFGYLFRYAIPVPEGAMAVTLPRDGNLRLVAATVAEGVSEQTVPTTDLAETLPPVPGTGPTIMPSWGQFHDSIAVNLGRPLYWKSGNPLRYTTDGSTPGPSSPIYREPLWISRPTTITVAEVSPDGRTGLVSRARLDVVDTTPPRVLSAVAMPESLIALLEFSERLNPASAKDASHYAIEGGPSVISAELSDSGRTVELRLSAPIDHGATIRLSGVTDLAEHPNPTSSEPIAIAPLKPVYENLAPQTFAGTQRSRPTTAPTVPVEASHPWTINQWVFVDSEPADLTVVGGFGDGRDHNGSERFLIYNRGQLYFWGSNIDIASRRPLDHHRWQMVTLTYDGTNLRIYKDGQLATTAMAKLKDAAGLVWLAPTGPWGNRTRLKGRIAGFTIWDAALPDESVKALLRSAPASD